MASIKNPAVFDFTEIPADIREEFEYVSAYLVDTYYNKLYVTAQEYLGAKRKPTLSECYRMAITNFLVMFRDAQNANAILGQFHEYYSSISSKPLGYEECIYRIVQACIPEQFYMPMNRQQKTSFLMQIWVAAIQHMTNIIYKEYIPMILDSRDKASHASTTQQLQDEMVNILAIIREDFFSQFYTHTHVSKGNQNITAQMSAKMKSTIQKLVQEKTELKLRVQHLEKLVYKLHGEVEEAKETEATIRAECEDMRVQTKTMEIAIRGYRRAVGEDENAPLPGLKKIKQAVGMAGAAVAGVAAALATDTRSETSRKSKTAKGKQQQQQQTSAYRDYFNPDHFERDIQEQMKDTAAVRGGTAPQQQMQQQQQTKQTKTRRQPEPKSESEEEEEDDDDDEDDGDEEKGGDNQDDANPLDETSLEDEIRELEQIRSQSKGGKPTQFAVNVEPKPKKELRPSKEQAARDEQSPMVVQAPRLSDVASVKSDVPDIDLYT